MSPHNPNKLNSWKKRWSLQSYFYLGCGPIGPKSWLRGAFFMREATVSGRCVRETPGHRSTWVISVIQLRICHGIYIYNISTITTYNVCTHIYIYIHYIYIHMYMYMYRSYNVTDHQISGIILVQPHVFGTIVASPPGSC